MFLAIINDSYSEAKDLIPDTKVTFGMGDYIKMGYKAILTKLKFKRDKLGDMKMALEAAHVRHDRVLTLGDWKQDLISRGYKTEEITAVFEKYDSDHDGKLTESEQKQLQQDLQKQEETLASEFRDLDAMEAEDDDIDMSIQGTDLAGVSSQEFLVLSNEVETISNRMEVLEVEVTKIRNSIKKILKHLGREEVWA
ncbi:Polycystin-2 [Lamellibrachia satsuma]|nr:Polycystin-2 [Lamellibrachia satsuma]